MAETERLSQEAPFGSGPLQYLAQEQNGPLGWRQLLECNEESESDLFAARRTVLRVGFRIGEQVVRKRFQSDCFS